MRTEYYILSTALASGASAWHYSNGYGFGDAPSTTNQSLFRDAIRQANTSKSVPFTIGSQNFQFQVNVTSLHISGADTPQNDPSTAFTLYSLLWDGQSDLNTTISEAEGVDDGQQPRLCATIPLGLFTASITNGYSEDDKSDCSGALGKNCIDDLNSAGFGGVIDGCRPADLPKSCQGKLSDGGLGTSSILNNGTQSSPAGFAFYTEASETGSPKETEAFTGAVQRLHMVIFADQSSYYPVCLRIRDDEVSKGDPATASASRPWSAVSWPLATAFTLLLTVFIMP